MPLNISFLDLDQTRFWIFQRFRLVKFIEKFQNAC